MKKDLVKKMREVHAKFPMNRAPLKQALGEVMPTIEPTRIGRHRLLEALRLKYGDSFRQHPHAKSALDSFDKDFKTIDLIRKVKART